MGGVVLFDVCSSRSIQFWRPRACVQLCLSRPIVRKTYFCQMDSTVPEMACVCSPPRLSNGTAGLLWGGMGGRLWVAESFAWLHLFEMGVVRALLLLLLLLLKLSFTYIWTVVERGWGWGCRERE